MSRYVRHIHADPSEWIAVHRDHPTPPSSDAPEMAGALLALVGVGLFIVGWFIYLVYLLLASIPLWVYLTIGGGLAAWGLIRLLGALGVYKAVGGWWDSKPDRWRATFRKRCWYAILGATVLGLWLVFPITMSVMMGLLAATLCLFMFLRRRRRRYADVWS